MTSARTNCSLTNSFQIQFQNLSTMNHKKTSCILLSCLFACKCIIQEVTLFSLLDLPSAEGGSFFRTDWLKTPHRWLNFTAIITPLQYNLAKPITRLLFYYVCSRSIR